MRQGLLVTNDFFTDHFPDKVVAVLSELAMKYSAASSNGMTRHHSFSSEALGGDALKNGAGDQKTRRDENRRGANLMEDLVKEQRSERKGTARDDDD